MAHLSNTMNSYQQLKKEWNSAKPNLSKCGEFLSELKIPVTQMTFFPTLKNIASQKELILAREILEIGAQWSIESQDIPSFERFMSQLKCYYFDFQNLLPESNFKYHLLGLNLLFLLSQNRVAEFHTELELLPYDHFQSDVYVRHPLNLEQYLMEGSYNKIFLAKGNVPAKNYNFFMDILLETIRGEIALCLERAYQRISLSEVTGRLYLPNEQTAKEYGVKRGWKLESDSYYNFSQELEEEKDPIPSTELAEQVLTYAKELEKIV